MRYTLALIITTLAALAAPARGQVSLTISSPSPGNPVDYVEFQLDVLNQFGVQLREFSGMQATNAAVLVRISTAADHVPNGTTERYRDRQTLTTVTATQVRATIQNPSGWWPGMYLPPGRYGIKVAVTNGFQIDAQNYPVVGGTPEVRDANVRINANTGFDHTGAPALLRGALIYVPLGAPSLTRISRVNLCGDLWGDVIPSIPAFASPSSPQQGFPFRMQFGLGTAPGLGATYAELLIGFSVPFTPTPLPPGVALSSFDRVWMAVDSNVPMTPGGMFYPWEVTLAIPTNPSLVGQNVYFQAAGFVGSQVGLSGLVASQL